MSPKGVEHNVPFVKAANDSNLVSEFINVAERR